MRLSTQQFYSQNLTNVRNTNADLFKTQQQLSTGNKFQQPSDDPLAASQIVKFDHSIARTDQFLKNVDVSERRLKLEESTLSSSSDAILRAKDLAIQAKNGTMSQSDRETIATQLDQVLKQLVGLANTQDAQGEYLFSGHKGTTKPYVLNGSTYEFQGDSGVRHLDIGEDRRIQSTDSAATVFENASVGGVSQNVFNTLQKLSAALKDPTTPDISSELSSAQDYLDASYNSVVNSRARLGARLQTIDDQRNTLQDAKLYTQNTRSSFADTDYYEATSNLMLEQNALQAAYSSFGRVQKLSLFNYVQG